VDKPWLIYFEHIKFNHAKYLLMLKNLKVMRSTGFGTTNG